MAAPTREDAELMLQVLQWAASIGMKEAGASVMAEDFDPESAEPSDEAVSTVLAVGEVIGALVKHQLLSRELVDDIIWVSGSWARVGPAALKARAEAGEPRIYENFEALAKAS
jgi:hypothetical protein